ncbi:MAG: ABC transporter ATP-binding protein [Candidatus Eisenbacteria bacterium]
MIRAEGITHRWVGGKPVLREVSFEIGRGEKVVLLGANGTGKTTLLKIMDGLIPPERGALRYDGRIVDGKALGDRDFHRRFRREVVYLFQNPDSMMFHPTVRDEIAFGPRQIGMDDPDGRARRWADEFGVGTLLERSPFELSGGEKQKVCLAALLAVEPKVLLLDEPAANLDPRSTGWLVDFLRDLPMTVVTTTHNLSLGQELGDRTLVLSEKHELIYDGPVEALLGDEGKLLEANLVHIHRHRHGDAEHRHYHTHDWE